MAMDTVSAPPLVNSSIGCDAGAAEPADAIEGEHIGAGRQRGGGICDFQSYSYCMHGRGSRPGGDGDDTGVTSAGQTGRIDVYVEACTGCAGDCRNAQPLRHVRKRSGNGNGEAESSASAFDLSACAAGKVAPVMYLKSSVGVMAKSGAAAWMTLAHERAIKAENRIW